MYDLQLPVLQDLFNATEVHSSGSSQVGSVAICANTFLDGSNERGSNEPSADCCSGKDFFWPHEEFYGTSEKA